VESVVSSKNFLFVALTLTGVSTVIGCLLSQRHSLSKAEAASGPIGAGNPSAANAKLEKAVESMLATDEEVRRAHLSVHADVTKNEVILVGAVPSAAIRNKAVALAKSAHAGVIVSDRITVKERKTTD
jgi:osmotically-inducible protein OsmY